MRLFLNSGVAPAYLRQFSRKWEGVESFVERRRLFIEDRFGAMHFLKPVLDGSETAFFTNADDEILQRAWAREHGMTWQGDLAQVLLAQIEEHRTEVFYNLDPMRFGSEFLRRLPGSVRCTVCWRAAPSPGVDFGAYNLIVCNFPSIIQTWRKKGWRAEYFSPAHDPVMDEYAEVRDRPIDVCFVGGYSRHHKGRAATLEAVAQMSGRFKIHLYLDCSRLTRLAEHPLLMGFALRRHRRPADIQAIARGPIFGRDLYEVLGSSKIVLNGAIDMAGSDRGNMRCFEAMGAGALLLSDDGRYPEGMIGGENMLVYNSPQEAMRKAERALKDWARYSEMADHGYSMVRTSYSKERQWREFVRLMNTI